MFLRRITQFYFRILFMVVPVALQAGAGAKAIDLEDAPDGTASGPEELRRFISAQDLAVPWDIEQGVRIPKATSSCTVRLDDGTYRTYLAGISTAVSEDGVNWTPPTPVKGLQGSSGEVLRNPTVLIRPDGRYLMVYEGVRNRARRRFYRAISADGVNFTRTSGPLAGGAVMLPEVDENNFISLPDMVQLDENRIRIYFEAFGDHIESAISTDNGVTWKREGSIAILGLTAGRTAMAPDVVKTDDDQYVLFFAASAEGGGHRLDNKRILSAHSSDGRVFTLQAGERVGVADGRQDLMDPDVVRLSDGNFRMYFGQADSPGGGYDLRSAVMP